MKGREMLVRWRQVRADTLATMGKFNTAELEHRPFESGRTVAEILLHFPNTEDGWVNYVLKREISQWPPDYKLSDYPTVSAIKTLLAAVHKPVEDYLVSLPESEMETVVSLPWGGKMTVGEIIWHLVEHEIHHRGELSLILGMLGREGLDV